jgi:hypothetical protein
MNLSIGEVAHRLGATTDEVLDAAGLTLGELELATEGCGLLPERYRETPVLPEGALKVIAERINSGRLGLAFT